MSTDLTVLTPKHGFLGKCSKNDFNNYTKTPVTVTRIIVNAQIAAAQRVREWTYVNKYFKIQILLGGLNPTAQQAELVGTSCREEALDSTHILSDRTMPSSASGALSWELPGSFKCSPFWPEKLGTHLRLPSRDEENKPTHSTWDTLTYSWLVQLLSTPTNCWKILQLYAAATDRQQ